MNLSKAIVKIERKKCSVTIDVRLLEVKKKIP